MSDRILDIDHLMIHVPDAQKAGDALADLGFTVTPLSSMPGLANRLICFADTDAQAGMCNYIELMGLTDADVAPAPMPELLGNGFGPVSTVMSVDDAEAVRQRLVAGGLRVGSVLDLQRDWQLPSGDVITPAFAVAIPEPGQSPFYWNYCEHKTPQHYVRAEFTRHANHIERLNAVLAVHEQPASAAHHYARHWNAAIGGDDPVRVQMATVTLEIYTPAAFKQVFELEREEPGLVGLRLGTSDIAAARTVMAGNGTDPLDMDDGFLIRPEQAADTMLVVEHRDAGTR